MAEKTPQELLEQRRIAYARLFSLGNPTENDVKVVMDDLAVFCRAFESTVNPNPKLQDVFEGRREVYLRILEHTLLDREALFTRYHTRGRTK